MVKFLSTNLWSEAIVVGNLNFVEKLMSEAARRVWFSTAGEIVDAYGAREPGKLKLLVSNQFKSGASRLGEFSMRRFLGA